ncbi:MAG: hypothetical protein ACKO8Y_07210 [Actinomycetota bacterium]
MELKENATFLGFVGVSDQDGMFVGVGGEGFTPPGPGSSPTF